MVNKMLNLVSMATIEVFSGVSDFTVKPYGAVAENLRYTVSGCRYHELQRLLALGV